MTTQSNADRQKAYRNRKKLEQGLKEVRGIWLCDEDARKIKEYAVMLQRVRAAKESK